VFQDINALRYSVACVSALAGTLSIAFLAYNLRQYKRAYIESQSWTIDSAPASN
jgi:hypothetical protein